MTLQIFMFLVAIFSVVTGLLTEAIKKVYQNAGKDYSPNLIALINAAVVGGAGSVAAYILLAIPLNPVSIVTMLILIFVVWIGSMIGFDKIKELLEQLNIK